ncbi:hypothetical protein Rcae01_06402 [Novipirellula caenicola]|uniref:Uncharacterized protein n=1 Tax=Novipirellula caenicola TaxID=1536901 RepID=A0ABP9W2Z5_9BACT
MRTDYDKADVPQNESPANNANRRECLYLAVLFAFIRVIRGPIGFKFDEARIVRVTALAVSLSVSCRRFAT